MSPRFSWIDVAVLVALAWIGYAIGGGWGAACGVLAAILLMLVGLLSS